jgi:hypothetical protein
VDDDMPIQTIHAALDSGITFALASPRLIPLCGGGRPESIRDSALAIEAALSEDDPATVDFAQPPRRFHRGSRQ